MMLVQAVLIALASSSFVTATTTIKCSPPKKTPEPISQCNTGQAQCCNSVVKAVDPAAITQLGLLGIIVEGLDVLVGLKCSPIAVVKVGGGKCNQQPVCCENNKFNGVINIGCTPLSL